MDALTQQPHRQITVRSAEDAGAARRAVARIAAGLPSAGPAAEAELAATELATNLVKHAAPGGYLLCRKSGDGIELISVDKGPGLPAGWLRGIENAVPAAEPRAGGLGLGLATVRRLSDVFDCYSGTAGTVILARLRGCNPSANAHFAWGAVNVPLGGSGESGDGWSVAAGRSLSAILVDGLGHGPDAAAAAAAAVTAFSSDPDAGPADILLHAHEAMRGTRGGVIGACTVDPSRGELCFAGLGNISGRLLNGTASQGLVSQDGTAGTQLAPPRARVLAFPWGPDAMLTLTSDGIGRHWNLRDYPGLLRRDPAVVAATVHRDHQRGSDDATILLVRDKRGDAA